MKKILTGTLAALLCMALVLSAALAETLSLEGTVTAGDTVPVYAPIGGTVGGVKVAEGQQVAAGDVLYEMKTSKVYAVGDGTVTGIFGQPGDSAETVAERYGAVMYLEESAVFSVSATTENAYNATDTKFIHVGETVYLVCRSNSSRSGEGIVTAVSGTSYTVRVTSGAFIPEDYVDVFRDAACSARQRLGRGTVSRIDPTAVPASGAIVRIAVEDGAQVKRGDLLLETLEGSFDGLYMSGTEITADTAGIVGSLNVEQGGSVQKGSIAAVIYPPDSMRAEAFVPEDSRSLIREGDAVTVELDADESKTYQGTVSLVSSVAGDNNGEAVYRVLVDFVPDDAVKIGMSVVILSGAEGEPAEEEPAEEKPEDGKPEEPAEEAGEADAAENGREGRRERRNRPEGTPEGGFPDGMPEAPGSETAGEGEVSDENAQQ